MKKLKVVFLLLPVLILAACVAVAPKPLNLNAEELPEGSAALYIAVPYELPGIANDGFRISIGDDRFINLKPESVNRIFLEEGVYALKLKRVPQKEENKKLKFYFTSGQTVRIILLRSENAEGRYEYRFAPATISGFNELTIESDLSIYKHD